MKQEPVLTPHHRSGRGKPTPGHGREEAIHERTKATHPAAHTWNTNDTSREKGGTVHPRQANSDIRKKRNVNNPTNEQTELTREEFEVLRDGEAVRIVTPAGLTFEGFIADKFKFGTVLRRSVIVNGREFSGYQHKFYRVDADTVTVRDHAPRELTDEEVRDWVADLESKHRFQGKPTAVTTYDIVEGVLGFSPHAILAGAAQGGKSNDTYVNQHLRVGSLRRSLDRLTGDGVLRKVVKGGYFNRGDERYVHILGKVGYVLSASYDESRQVVHEKDREQDLSKLWAQARGIVADRHTDEVEAEYERLVEEAGY